MAVNGLVMGPLLIVGGALVSYFTGMLLVTVSNLTKTERYEDMARTLYGKKLERMVGIFNIICLCSFVMSYVVFVKQTVPFLITKFAPLPPWCDYS